MSRRPDYHTPEGIAQRLAEGRGQGRGTSYKPYFTRFDVRSHGERRESYFQKPDRGIHFLSRLEFHQCLLAHEDPEIIDIREQFPLPLLETEAIAEELGILHPRYWKTGCHIVMTTDLVFTRRHQSGNESTEAWSAKYADALRHWRTAEKQEIEGCWHKRQGHSWRIMTEKDVPPTHVSNLAWLHPLRRRDATHGYPEDLPMRVDEVMRRLLSERPSELLPSIARECDAILGFGSRPVSLYFCRYLLAIGHWRTDLSSWLRDSQPLSLAS